jgi:hypothetical protein
MSRELPTAETHRVVAELLLPAPLHEFAKALKALARVYPGAVIITDGPLWKPDRYVVAVPVADPGRH